MSIYIRVARSDHILDIRPLIKSKMLRSPANTEEVPGACAHRADELEDSFANRSTMVVENAYDSVDHAQQRVPRHKSNPKRYAIAFPHTYIPSPATDRIMRILQNACALGTTTHTQDVLFVLSPDDSIPSSALWDAWVGRISSAYPGQIRAISSASYANRRVLRIQVPLTSESSTTNAQNVEIGMERPPSGIHASDVLSHRVVTQDRKLWEGLGDMRNVCQDQDGESTLVCY
jgi:hypothetical protein